MVRLNPSLRQQISQAYVSHRLNNSELVEVTEHLKKVEAGQESPLEARQLLKDYSLVNRDERAEVSHQQLTKAIGYLHLDGQLSALHNDQAWSPYQRALCRRLSDTSYDPVPMSARGEEKGSPAFVATVQENFEGWDADGDGALTPTELDRAMANPALLSAGAAAAVVLRRQGVHLEKCSPEGQSGVTRQDLEQFLLAGIPENAMSTYKVNRGFASQLQAADRMGPAPTLLTENFDPEMVEQGRAGSCVMLSTLASKDETSVKEMFRPLPDGQVEIRFADGQFETVRDLTLAERLYHAKSPEGGRWPGLLEVAIGQRIQAHNPSEDGSFRSSANSIPVAEASLALHGKVTEKVAIDGLSLNQTRDLLSQVAHGPKPWLAGSRHTPKGQDSVVSVEDLYNGINNNHAYSIKQFDKENDVVWLRNPWRRGEWAINFDQKDDGVFAMPVRDFYSSFRWVSGPSAA